MSISGLLWIMWWFWSAVFLQDSSWKFTQWLKRKKQTVNVRDSRIKTKQVYLVRKISAQAEYFTCVISRRVVKLRLTEQTSPIVRALLRPTSWLCRSRGRSLVLDFLLSFVAGSKKNWCQESVCINEYFCLSKKSKSPLCFTACSSSSYGHWSD